MLLQLVVQLQPQPLRLVLAKKQLQLQPVLQQLQPLVVHLLLKSPLQPLLPLLLMEAMRLQHLQLQLR
jgi:hypothetical protein